jgi:hypothetical protein
MIERVPMNNVSPAIALKVGAVAYGMMDDLPSRHPSALRKPWRDAMNEYVLVQVVSCVADFRGHRS